MRKREREGLNAVMRTTVALCVVTGVFLCGIWKLQPMGRSALRCEGLSAVSRSPYLSSSASSSSSTPSTVQGRIDLH